MRKIKWHNSIIPKDDDMLNLGGYKSLFYSQQHFVCFFMSKIRGAHCLIQKVVKPKLAFSAGISLGKDHQI